MGMFGWVAFDKAKSLATKTADYIITANDEIIVANPTSANITLTLPSAATVTGRYFRIKLANTATKTVIIATVSAQTFDGLFTTWELTAFNSAVTFFSDGSNWFTDGPVYTAPRLLSRTSVLLTAAADTPLITVPAGKTMYISDVWLEGKTAQSGGTASKLLLGTSGSSYNEILNAATGHTFTAATASSLLVVGKRRRVQDLYPITTMSDGIVSFAAAAAVVANVTSAGGLLTGGAVWVELYGYLG